MTKTNDYGQYYWGVQSPASEENKLYLYAERVGVTGNGDEDEGHPELINLAFAEGRWTAFFAASMFDKSAVAVERWQGDIPPL